MRKLPLLLLTLASCQSSALEVGDKYFRQKSYLEAYSEYTQLDADDSEVQQRLEVTRYFLAEEMVRKLSNSGHPDEALDLLNSIVDGAPVGQDDVLLDLELRCKNHIATRHFDLALSLNDVGNKNGAIRELLVALSWREDFAPAIERLDIITERESMRNQQGIENYLEAVHHLENGNDVRARTSFMHAGNLLTDPQLANNRLNGISRTLAEESMRQAEMYLDAGQTGMAWAAVQDAIHLGMADDSALSMAQRIDNMLLSQAHLISADIRVRAGDHESANESIAKAASYSVVEHTADLIELRNRNSELHQQQRYLYARSYELDSQLQHARDIYLEIYAESEQFGYKDTEQRLMNISSRLTEAEMYYQQALSAAQNSDLQSHKDMLRSVLQIAIDYKDALYLFAEANNVELSE